MRVDTRKRFDQIDANAVRGRASTWRTRVADVPLATGQLLAVHSCVIVHLTDGQITPIDAYVDPTFEAQLGFVRGAVE
jgi:ketosteroid isomerase-like protein